MTDAASATAPEKGTYELLRDRLRAQATTLRERAEALNAKRVELFGSTELRVLGTERVRTANNCVPRDIVQVGELLLFGYNVFLGLKKETEVADVLALHEVVEDEAGQFSFPELRADDPRNLLRDESFQKDFRELYKYYKSVRLLQLRRTETKLLAIFQTGASVTDDLKVLRWAVGPDGSASYLDNRGERDHVYPPQHDFEWTRTTREDFVSGRHPHVSILDEVFVETVGGDLTIKIEDNTEDGQGIYREPVDDADQSLDDAEVRYAKLGSLILLEVRPYNEKERRYLVFNTRTRQVDRIDAIGQSCVQLPEDHGLIFPGGYYLQSGETKTFEADTATAASRMELERAVRSPNGEDVLYVFHERRSGRSILLPYNLIRKQVQNPIHCHGACLFDDGRMVLFRSTSEEPVRVHPMQVWQTPFCSPEHAAAAPRTGSHLEKVGNADLVRGISDALALARTGTEATPSVAVFEGIVAAAGRMQDAYYWLGHDEIGDLRAPVAELQKTADLVVGEFQKVEEARRRASDAVLDAERRLVEVERGLDPGRLQSVDAVVGALSALRRQRGHVRSVGEMRHADSERLAALEARIVEQTATLTAHAAELLSRPESFAAYGEEIATLAAEGAAQERVADLEPIRERLAEVAAGIELLTETTTQLEIADATVRTAVLEAIAAVLATLNRGRAEVEARRRELAGREGRAEFAAQFQLLAQAVSGALAMAATPERCDEELTRLLLQLEELESRFGESDELLAQLTAQREEIVEAFAAKKQTLLDERQRASDRLMQAAERILDGVVRRAASLGDGDALHAFFAGDAMIQKLRDLAKRLRELGAVVRADEVETRLQTARQEAQRSLRDRLELYEAGGETIRLGRHRFSVDTRPMELTLVPRQGGRGEIGGGEPEMAFHLAGTDYYEPAESPELVAAREHWPQLLVSETADVYRGEYLAFTLLRAAEEERDGLTMEVLTAEAADPAALAARARKAAAERYDEGYERGVHDHDAAAILGPLLGLYAAAGLLRFPPRPRAWAALFWAFTGDTRRRVLWERRAKSLARLRTAFAPSRALAELQAELGDAVAAFLAEHGLADRDAADPDDTRLAGAYLFEELAGERVRFVTSAEARALEAALWRHLAATGTQRALEEDLRELADDLGERVALATAWVTAYLDESAPGDGVAELRPALEEAVALLVTEKRLEREVSSAPAAVVVEGLLGHHPRIVERRMTLRLDEVLARLSSFQQRRVPSFRAYQALRHRLLEAKRRELRLGELQPRVMSAFVRNRLLDEVYLPLVADNLAKQLGALAEGGGGKRTDQMGLLLLVSPPGYGKTTLMEYVASRLGLVFVKVDGPALGHRVTSLDPAEAPNATARREIEKINLALAMGNNVLLYLDDIQHTAPELLQKFISLCDAQRKIEGVWRGEPRAYDLRGKRFAVVMAGNPYTESGQRFRIPDMLANRADTYNLGDVLSGRDEVFALSYLENAMTSNPVLAPLAGRRREDFFLLVRRARGEEVPTDRLEHPYTPSELEDVLAVLRKLIRVQEVLLAVNREYIASAAQEDAHRSEPRFQLQGSYRNMNRLAEKVVPVMDDGELEALLDDHYAGEAQTLTSGAEANRLKLRELRGVLSPDEARRWEEVKRGFRRQQTMGGPEEDPAIKVVGQLGLVSERLEDIGAAVAAAARGGHEADTDDASVLRATLGEVVAPWVAGIQRNLELLAERAASQGDGQPPTLTLSTAAARRLDALSDRLAALAAGLAMPPAASVAAAQPFGVGVGVGVDVGLAPYLERLDATLRLLAGRPATGLVHGPEVAALLDKLGAAVGETLLPLVQKLGRHAKKAAPADRAAIDLADRTLKSLDHMKTLVAALQRRPGVADSGPPSQQVATEA